MMIAKNDLFDIVGCENSYHHGQNPINWLIWSVYPQMSSPPQLELKIRGYNVKYSIQQDSGNILSGIRPYIG